MKLLPRRPKLRAIPWLIAVLMFAAPSAAATPSEFILSTSDRVFASLSEDGLSDAEYIDRFQRILSETFDLPYISRFVLGRYWRVASAAEKEAFGPLFEKFLVRVYSNRFRDLSKEKLTVLRSVAVTADSTLVLSQVEPPDKPPIKVDWRVRRNESGYKITDVVVEGLSMSVTQRDEFAAVMRRGGGKVAALLDALHRKIDSK